MSKGLRRYYGTRHLHFITCSCYRRQRLLGSAGRRNGGGAVIDITHSVKPGR